MSRKFSLLTVVFTVGFFSVLCGWSHDTFAQVSAQELDAKVAHTLESLQTEIQQVDEGIATAAWTTAEQPQRWSSGMVSVDREECCPEQGECCPACCEGASGCDGCDGICPARQVRDANRTFDVRELPPASNGFIQNHYAESASQQLCEDLAETMAECLSDSQIPAESRRRILATSMKLLVRNAELESQAEVARLQLEHERELAATRENLVQLQARMSAVGEVKSWMGPLYTNLNQTQQSMSNVMTNLQLVNRTLRLLENEKNVAKRKQANQPLPAQMVPQAQPGPRPERWSQLPKHSQPPRKTETQDHTTQQVPRDRNETFLSRSSQVAPPRLSDQEVQRQQLESRMRQLQAELDRLNSQDIRTVGWESETIQENPNQLRPIWPHPLRPVRENR